MALGLFWRSYCLRERNGWGGMGGKWRGQFYSQAGLPGHSVLSLLWVNGKEVTGPEPCRNMVLLLFVSPLHPQ